MTTAHFTNHHMNKKADTNHEEQSKRRRVAGGGCQFTADSELQPKSARGTLSTHGTAVGQKQAQSALEGSPTASCRNVLAA